MKFHNSLVFAVRDILHHIMIENAYADKALQKVFRENPKWGARDRAFIAESVYDLVRYWRFYQYICGDIDRVELLISAYWQLKFHALPEPWKKLALPETLIHEKQQAAQNIRAVRESIPDWLDEMGVLELPDIWDRELHALNREAAVVLRCNTIKTSREKLIQQLASEGIEVKNLESYPDALELVHRKNIFTTEAFKKGFCELQDASSQLVAPFLDIQNGMRVVDACAGAGGKSLHCASMMHNKGSLICLDTEMYKLEELKRRARRNGVSNIQIRHIEDLKTIKRLHQSADRLLLDVPCSGLGVIRRNPDAKWKLSPEFLVRVKSMQEFILDQYCKILKPGGKMVYATCSILPSENQEQVQNFLRNHPQFSMEEERIILPSESGYDGFYMARMHLLT